VFGYLILISIDFYNFVILFLCFLLSFSFVWEDISNTQDSVWPHFQTPQGSFKTLHCRSYFPQLCSQCLERWSNNVFCVSYITYYLPQLDFRPVNHFFFPVGGWVGEENLESMHSTRAQCRMPCSKGFLYWHKFILVN